MPQAKNERTDAARRIAVELDYPVVVVLSIDREGTGHVTSYGRNHGDRNEAARLGEVVEAAVKEYFGGD